MTDAVARTGADTVRGQGALSLAWYGAGALLFLGFGYTEMAGSDLWWHLAGGREILEQGTLWLRDTWSFTAGGERWRNHEWLSDLVFYGWQQAFGLPALVYWKWLVLVGCYGGLQALLYRLCGNHPASLILATLALMVGAPFLDMRPHLYSLLCTVILLHMLLSRAHFVALALLFLVWVNLHGGFIYGLLALPLLLFPYRDFSPAALWRAALTSLGCAAVCLLNPDGIKVVLMPLTYALQADSPFRQIAEWLPPWAPGGIRSPLFFWYLLLLPLSLLGYLLPAVRRRQPIPWPYLMLCLLTCAMALTSRRFIPLFAITQALFMAPLCGVLFGRVLRPRSLAVLAALVALVGIVRLAPYPLRAAPAFHYLTAEYTYPRYMVDVLEASDIRGRVFAYYNWGGYLHWRSDGALQVFIDGRANTLYTDQTYLDYVRVLRSGPDWQQVIDDSGADYVLWPTGRGRAIQQVRALLASGDWRLRLQTADAVLLQRADGMAAPLSAGPATPWQRLDAAELALVQGDYRAAARGASAVLEEIPWQRDACNTLVAAQRQLGEDAEDTRRRCRAQFPSRFLR